MILCWILHLAKRRFRPQICSIHQTPLHDRVIIQTSSMESQWTTNSFDIFLFNCNSFKIYLWQTYTKLTIFIILKCIIRWQQVISQCCVTIHNLFCSLIILFPKWEYLFPFHSLNSSNYNQCGEMITFPQFTAIWVQVELPSLDEIWRLCSLPERGECVLSGWGIVSWISSEQTDCDTLRCCSQNLSSIFLCSNVIESHISSPL